MSGHACDVLGLGVTAVDDLMYVAAYPPADAKARVLRSQRQGGGLTATALVAAARLGARCAYAGVLGQDEYSCFVEDALHREGIDVSHVVRREDARPVHSVIVVDEGTGTRNIFFDVTGAAGADAERPDAEIIRAAKVLFVDPYGADGMIRAAGIARAADVPVVADLEDDDAPRFGELLALVDHLVLPHEFATQLAGETDLAVAAAKLWTTERAAVVVTDGAAGCWYFDGGGAARHQPAFAVQAVDTTGCGDAFHGAYAAALAWGLDLAERVRFAAATAALKATRAGGQAGLPTRREVQNFLKDY